MPETLKPITVQPVLLGLVVVNGIHELKDGGSIVQFWSSAGEFNLFLSAEDAARLELGGTYAHCIMQRDL